MIQRVKILDITPILRGSAVENRVSVVFVEAIFKDRGTLFCSSRIFKFWSSDFSKNQVSTFQENWFLTP